MDSNRHVASTPRQVRLEWESQIRLLHSVLLTLLLALTVTACGQYPRDPHDTTGLIRDGIIDVGVSEHPPWIRRNGEEPNGVEADIIRKIAEAFNAEIAWHWGTTEENFAQLESGELELVAGGLNRKTPWGSRVALTSPYYRTSFYRHQMVLALPRGENGFLMTVDSILRVNREAIAASVPTEELP